MITKGIMLWSFNKLFIFNLLDAIFNGADNKNYIGWPSIGGWWGEEVLIKSEISQSNRLHTLSWLFLVLNRQVNIYLNFPKCNFLCSFVLANVLAIATGSIVSAGVLWAVQPILHHRVPKVCFEASQSGKILLRCERLVFFFNGGRSHIQQN